MLPTFVMMEITRLDQDCFKIALVDKKHGDELDCEIHKLPLPAERDYGYIRGVVYDYKDSLLLANVI